MQNGSPQYIYTHYRLFGSPCGILVQLVMVRTVKCVAGGACTQLAPSFSLFLSVSLVSIRTRLERVPLSRCAPVPHFPISPSHWIFPSYLRVPVEIYTPRLARAKRSLFAVSLFHVFTGPNSSNASPRTISWLCSRFSPNDSEYFPVLGIFRDPLFSHTAFSIVANNCLGLPYEIIYIGTKDLGITEFISEIISFNNFLFNVVLWRRAKIFFIFISIFCPSFYLFSVRGRFEGEVYYLSAFSLPRFVGKLYQWSLSFVVRRDLEERERERGHVSLFPGRRGCRGRRLMLEP